MFDKNTPRFLPYSKTRVVLTGVLFLIVGVPIMIDLFQEGGIQSILFACLIPPFSAWTIYSMYKKSNFRSEEVKEKLATKPFVRNTKGFKLWILIVVAGMLTMTFHGPDAAQNIVAKLLEVLLVGVSAYVAYKTLTRSNKN